MHIFEAYSKLNEKTEALHYSFLPTQIHFSTWYITAAKRNTRHFFIHNLIGILIQQSRSIVKVHDYLLKKDIYYCPRSQANTRLVGHRKG